MTPISPDEALYAFVDGELELSDEQQLFDALASHPELRTEMKDVLAIRNAVHRDVLFPPAAAETEILAAAGLLAPVGAVAVATGPTLMSRLLHTGGGILAGVVLAYFLFNANGTNQTQGGNQAMSEQGAQTSQNLDVQTGATPPTAVPPVRVETLYVRVPAKATPATAPSQSIANTNTTNPNSTSPNATASTADSESSQLAISSLTLGTPPMYMASNSLALGPLFRDTRFIEASPLAPGTVDVPFSVRMRSLPSSVGSDRKIPQSVNDAVLANAAFAFLMPVTPDVRVGLEVGFEAFNQVFTSMRDGRPIRVEQTPVLTWFGGTAEWSPSEIDLLLSGLRPFASISGGYALAQGPVGHIYGGLQYQPIGPVRISAGYSLGVLGYRDGNNWFGSVKHGVIYALSVDL